MLLSTHYYVLSLGTERSVLYEAFRDALIRVDNQGFPVEHAIGAPAARLRDDLHAHVRMVDRCFDYYDSRERLGLILVGDEELQSAFDLVTTHGTALIGRVKGDRSQARDGDLGQMVWPVIKEAMSSVVDRAMHDLDRCSRDGHLASGLDAVAAAAAAGTRGMLLVEEDFRVRGSLVTVSQPPAISPDVDIRDEGDDAVDAVIERLLASGGSAVFVRSGSLTDRGRIVLLLRESNKP